MKAKPRRVLRDMEHTISRALVDVAVERQAGTIVLGDVRDSADGIDTGHIHNPRRSQGPHGQVRSYVPYKAKAEGLAVVVQSAWHTSQTCPQCGHRQKPRSRRYVCKTCGCSGPRDVVGQVNSLSAYLHGEPG
jgi:putative transposase